MKRSQISILPARTASAVCLLFIALGSLFAQVPRPLQNPGEAITVARFLADAFKIGETNKVRLRGTVTHVISDQTYTIQDETGAVYAFDKPDPPLHRGDRVEVVANPSLGGLVPTLQNCSAEFLGPGSLPKAQEISGSDLLNVTNAMRRVRITGRVLDENIKTGRSLLVRSADDTASFHVNLEAVENLPLLARPQQGSQLEVTGVLVIRAGAGKAPISASILVQDLSDLTQISGPPFWNHRRVIRTAIALAAAVALILVWVLLLRHQVDRQTREIQERLKREAALKDRFAKVFRASPDPLMITRTPDDVVLEVNPAFQSLTGLPVDAAVGRRESELALWTNEKARSAAVTTATTKGSVNNIECTVTNKNGNRVTCLYSAETIELDGARCRLGLFRDITEQKRAEEERQMLQKRLERAQRMESLGTLAGGVAHDFNNLLASILGNTDLGLLTSELPRDVTQCLQEIRAASLRGRDLVQRILAFSRPQQSARRPIALAPVIAEAAALLRPSMPPGVWLQTDLDPNCPLVLADATQVHQIVMNLGVNAAHAMEGKPGNIRIQLKNVVLDGNAAALVTEAKPGKYVALVVSDQGVGMSPEIRNRIFEPFFTTKEPGRGTGLGLAAVHGFVSSYGGAVDVQSEPDRGSTFTVYFPPTDVAPTAPVPPTMQPSVKAAPTGVTVLLIDDEEMVLSVVKRVLERAGHTVVSFNNPQEALDQFDLEPARFNVALTDMNMPHMSGLEVASRLHSARPDLPIILASGNVTEELRAQATATGACRVIAKPVTAGELQAMVAEETKLHPT